MSFRTNATAVGKLVEVEAGIDLDPFMETANALVTEVCVPAGYDDTRLELIERWLSAHFYRIRVPTVDFEKADVVAERRAIKVGYGFDQTTYGQQALRLDTAGGLAKLEAASKEGKATRVQMLWLGTCEDHE